MMKHANGTECRDPSGANCQADARVAELESEVARLAEGRDRLQREATRPCWGEDEQGVSRPHAELLERQREDIWRLERRSDEC